MTERINYEVMWGVDERDRTLYTDSGDGSFISETAEVRATRTFLDMVKAGVRVGFSVNGIHNGGTNITAAHWAVEDGKALYAKHAPCTLATPSGRWTGTGDHRTRTTEWQVGDRYKTKSNGSCGRYVPTMLAKAECLCAGASTPTTATKLADERVHTAPPLEPTLPDTPTKPQE